MFKTRRAAHLLAEARSLANRVPSIDADRRAHAESVLRLASDAASASRAARDLKGETVWSFALLLSAEYEHQLGDTDAALMVLFASASTRWSAGDDCALAQIAVEVSRIYSRLGDAASAAEFALEAHRRFGHQERPAWFISWLYGMLLAANASAVVQDNLKANDYEHLDEPYRSLMRIIAHRSGLKAMDSDDLLRCLEQIDYLPSESAGFHRVVVASSLARAGRLPDAVRLLRRNIQRLRDENDSAWSIARNRQLLAHLLVRSGDHEQACQLALDAWSVGAAGLASTGSPRLRAAIRRSFSLARASAMSSAVALGDYRLLTELLECARLQAEPVITGNGEDLDKAISTGYLPPRPSAAGARKVDAGAAPEPWGLLVEHTFTGRMDLGPLAFITVDGESRLADAAARLRDEVLHLPQQPGPRHDIATARRAAGLESDDYWLHTWVEGTTLFWSVSRSAVFEGGSRDLAADMDLRRSLATCATSHGLEPLVELDWQPLELGTSLKIADSWHELEVTLPLATIIPESIASAMELATQAAPVTLAISLAPELSVVPWPIIPIRANADAPRLVERAVLHFMPSVVTLVGLRHQSNEPAAIPFLLSCDYMHDFARNPALEVPPKRARARLGTPAQVHNYSNVKLATLESLAKELRSTSPGAPGLAFFRTHYERLAEDPSSSGLALHNGRAEAGMLFITDEVSGRPVLPMPSDVVLSCCSSAPSADDNGGETAGIVAGCLRSGAARVIATAVDVIHASFTNAFDDMLIDIMLGRRDHTTALRELQLRMLSEWRLYSMRSEVQASELDVRDPLPTIWAYFQAYGRRASWREQHVPDDVRT